MSTSPVTMDFLAARSIFHLWLLITLVLAKVVETRASTKELRAKFKVTNTGSGPYGAFVPNVDTFRMEQMIRLNSSIMEELVVFIGDRSSPNMYTICQIVLDKCVCPPLSTIKDGCYCLYCDGTEIKFIIQVLSKAFMQGQKITVERQKKDDPNSRSLVAQKALPMICGSPYPLLYIDHKLSSVDNEYCQSVGPTLGKKVKVLYCVGNLQNPVLEIRFDKTNILKSKSKCISTDVVFQREHLGTSIQMSYHDECFRNATLSCKFPILTENQAATSQPGLLKDMFKPVEKGSCKDGSFVADIDTFRFEQTINVDFTSLSEVEVYIGKRGSYTMHTVCKLVPDKCLCPPLSTKAGCYCKNVDQTVYTFIIQVPLEGFANRRNVTIEAQLKNEVKRSRILAEKSVPRMYGNPHALLLIDKKKVRFDGGFCLGRMPALDKKIQIVFCVANLKNPFLEVRFDQTNIFKSNSTCIYEDVIFRKSHYGANIQMSYWDECQRNETVSCRLPTAVRYSVNGAAPLRVALDVLAMMAVSLLLTNEAWTIGS